MSYYHVEVSKVIDAHPEKIYAIISDYHEGHPSILPTRYFTDMIVTEGGQGEGTVTTIHMKVFGTKFIYKMSVTEPEPGRVLVEEDKDAGVITTFTLDPINGTKQTRVTIATKAKTSAGLKGMIEKLMTPLITRKIYREELLQLAEIVQRKREEL